MTTDEPARLTPEELAAESGSELPDKEVMSLLDLNANLDLALDAAAPIDLAIGANANVAAPIEASVGANVLSTGSTAGAEAVQVGEIHQGITGDATATSAQHSSIVQGADTTQPVAPDSPRTLEVGQSGSEQVMWLSDSPALPTASHPALGLVLRPEHGDGPTWVFPFDKPAPPGAGDNQALAVNTRDGTVVDSVAFALVWAGSGAVLNTNSAYAFASCRGCGAVANRLPDRAIPPNAHIVVPQNLSGAVTYRCIVCFADALAVQLAVTVDRPLTAAQRDAVLAVWRKIIAFGSHLVGLSFAQIQDALAGYQRQIVAIVHTRSAP